MIRFFPFWAVPLALVCFEVGLYHYNRRTRALFVSFFAMSGMLVIAAILWVVFEGYWRFGPWVKRWVEG